MSQYTTIPNAVLPVLAKIHGMAIGVYVALKSYADREGVCYPSLDAVAQLSGTSVPTVQRVLRAMVDGGLVTKLQRNTGAGRVANLYQFPMIPQTNGVPAQWSDRPCPMVPQTTPNGLTDQGSNSTEVTTNKNAPSLDRERCSAAAARHDYTPEFERWWSHYPRLRRTDKLDCSRKYATAAKRVGHEKLLEAVIAYAASDQGRGKYCPEPARWLAKGRYEDDPASWRDHGGNGHQGKSTLPPPLKSARELRNDRKY
jgi:hypothetical protein